MDGPLKVLKLQADILDLKFTKTSKSEILPNVWMLEVDDIIPLDAVQRTLNSGIKLWIHCEDEDGIKRLQTIKGLYLSTDYDWDELTTLDLKGLHFVNSGLKAFPSVVNELDLDILSSDTNKIMEVPNLQGLKVFNVEYGELVSLPELPDTLVSLDLTHNHLGSIPDLPLNLKHLYLGSNKLNYLPELPPNLIHLHLFDNNLKYLPKLPLTIEELSIDNNDSIEFPTELYSMNRLKLLNIDGDMEYKITDEMRMNIPDINLRGKDINSVSSE